MGILIFRVVHHRSDHGGGLFLSRPSGSAPRLGGRRRPSAWRAPDHVPGDAHPQDPVQGHLELDRRHLRRRRPRLGAWARSTSRSSATPATATLHPHLLPDHHALHRLPRRDAEVRVARPGPPLPLLQGEERRPQLQDPGHERHHRRPHRRPLRHRVRRGHAGRPPVRAQGAPARGRLRRTG